MFSNIQYSEISAIFNVEYVKNNGWETETATLYVVRLI